MALEILLEDVTGESCEPTSGMAMIVYYALHSDFTTIQDPPNICGITTATFATAAAITADHVFKAGKGFNKIKVVSETGTVVAAPLGERKRKVFQNTFTAQKAGSESEVLGMMRIVKNGEYIVLVEEAGSGRVRQIGSSRMPAEFSDLTHTIEPAFEGNNSLAFSIQDKQKWPAPIYSGDIVTLPITP